jgi:hypothetical protein
MCAEPGRGTLVTSRKRLSDIWASILTYMNPARVLEEAGIPVYLSYVISGLAFTLLFLQVGIDMHRAGTRSPGGVVLLLIIGFLFGTAGVALLASVSWGLAKAFGTEWELKRALNAFPLVYTPTLIYAVIGLLFNVAFGWNTAISFGVTGVLWALGPILVLIREMTRGKVGASMLGATICGLLALCCFALIVI